MKGFYGNTFQFTPGNITDREIIKNKSLLYMADYDYLTARYLFCGGPFFALQICNHIQQSFEKYLKFAQVMIFKDKPDRNHIGGNFVENALFLSIPAEKQEKINKLCGEYIKGYRYFEQDMEIPLDECMQLLDEFVYEYYSCLQEIRILRLLYVSDSAPWRVEQYGKFTHMLTYLFRIKSTSITPYFDFEILRYKNNFFDKMNDFCAELPAKIKCTLTIPAFEEK